MSSFFDICNPLYSAIIVYIILIVFIVIIKPKFMYDDKAKKFKPFGSGTNETLLSFPVVAIISAVIIYISFSLYSAMCEKMNQPTNNINNANNNILPINNQPFLNQQPQHIQPPMQPNRPEYYNQAYIKQYGGNYMRHPPHLPVYPPFMRNYPPPTYNNARYEMSYEDDYDAGYYR